MVTLKTIAKITGVSPSTVSRILSGKNKTKHKNVERILEIAERLGYTKNFLAKSIRTGKSYTIGVLISNISYTFYPEIIKGIDDILTENEYSFILKNSYENPKKEKQALHEFVERQVEGIIISPVIENVNETYFYELRKKDIPFVVIDREYPFIRCNFVGVDDREGGYKAVKYLIELGHTHIGMISGPLSTTTGKNRFEGYKDAIIESGLKFNPYYVKEGIYGDKSLEIGFKKTKELIEEFPQITAIFYGTDNLAIGGIKYLKEKKIKIPENISIIGFGDTLESQLVEPRLTTVKQPKYEIGKEAGKLILKKIKEKEEGKGSKIEEKILKTVLIIRETTKERENS